MKNSLVLIFINLAVIINNYSQNIDLVNLIPKCKPAIISITTYDKNNNVLGTGTGFFINSSGLALSCYHVFEGASKALVKTYDNKEFLVNNIISQSKERDILKFSVSNEFNETFNYLPIEKKNIKEGESIFVIGNPLGLENTVSNGIISSIRSDSKFGKIIQVTAPLSAGNSGSPLLNKDGYVVGIVTFSFIEGQNLNFCVSIEEINFLTPYNKYEFPKKEEDKISRNNSFLQLFDFLPFGQTSLADVKQKFQYLEIDIEGTKSKNSNLTNNYSKVLVYKNASMFELAVDLIFTFEFNNLTKIEIQSPFMNISHSIPFKEVIFDYIQIYDLFTGLFGSSKFLIWADNEDPIKADQSILKNDNIDRLSSVIKKTNSMFALFWLFEDTIINATLCYYGESKNPPYQDTGFWIISFDTNSN